MSKILEIPFGTINEERNAVFLAIHLKSKCYEGYKNVKEHIQKSDFGQVLLLNRWDGSKGFVGGNVDAGENLLTAMQREVFEEINFTIPDISKVKEVCSHQAGSINLHLYSLEIDLDTKRNILQNAWKAKDYEAEVCGVMFQQIFSNEEGRTDVPCIERFLSSNLFAKGVKEELEILIEKENLNLMKPKQAKAS